MDHSALVPSGHWVHENTPLHRDSSCFNRLFFILPIQKVDSAGDVRRTILSFELMWHEPQMIDHTWRTVWNRPRVVFRTILINIPRQSKAQPAAEPQLGQCRVRAHPMDESRLFASHISLSVIRLRGVSKNTATPGRTKGKTRARPMVGLGIFDFLHVVSYHKMSLGIVQHCWVSFNVISYRFNMVKCHHWVSLCIVTHCWTSLYNHRDDGQTPIKHYQLESLPEKLGILYSTDDPVMIIEKIVFRRYNLQGKQSPRE